VDREAFAGLVTERVASHRLIRLVREEMPRLPEGTCIVASGPLTSPSLSEDIAQLGGEEHLYFYDALAPIVAAESIDMSIAFRASRFGRGEEAEGDYINCPLDREEYARFVEALTSAERIALRDFERATIEAGVNVPTALTPNRQPLTPDTFFEGCLPIEVLASRGLESLAFGPMRPIGLYDPRTGRRPHAAVQLRQDNLAGTLYNIVGFQTNLTWPEQKRVLRMIPGLEKAEFIRYGQMHRNTFINAPKLLEPTLQFRGRADLFFAGQITGVEGYIGNAATGLLAGVNAAHRLQGKALWSLPQTTMLGALCWYVTHAEPGTFQPMKANFGLLPPLESANGRKLGKRDRGAAYAGRALADLETYLAEVDR
jgi:methylenetetrahydrofolate--tRNA-(uracil-5-)-methyltransferase